MAQQPEKNESNGDQTQPANQASQPTKPAAPAAKKKASKKTSKKTTKKRTPKKTTAATSSAAEELLKRLANLEEKLDAQNNERELSEQADAERVEEEAKRVEEEAKRVEEEAKRVEADKQRRRELMTAGGVGGGATLFIVGILWAVSLMLFGGDVDDRGANRGIASDVVENRFASASRKYVKYGVAFSIEEDGTAAARLVAIGDRLLIVPEAQAGYWNIEKQGERVELPESISIWRESQMKGEAKRNLMKSMKQGLDTDWSDDHSECPTTWYYDRI